MQYKLFKLTSGDTVLASCTDDLSFEKNEIQVLDPVLLTPARKIVDGSIVETFYMQPWNSLLEPEDQISIFTRNIVAQADLTGHGKSKYLSYVQFEEEFMDYGDLEDLSEATQELARRFLESQEENIEEQSEEEDSDGQIIH